jgi:hypothetical protein
MYDKALTRIIEISIKDHNNTYISSIQDEKHFTINKECVHDKLLLCGQLLKLYNNLNKLLISCTE